MVKKKEIKNDVVKFYFSLVEIDKMLMNNYYRWLHDEIWAYGTLHNKSYSEVYKDFISTMIVPAYYVTENVNMILKLILYPIYHGYNINDKSFIDFNIDINTLLSINARSKLSENCLNLISFQFKNKKLNTLDFKTSIGSTNTYNYKYELKSIKLIDGYIMNYEEE